MEEMSNDISPVHRYDDSDYQLHMESIQSADEQTKPIKKKVCARHPNGHAHLRKKKVQHAQTMQPGRENSLRRDIEKGGSMTMGTDQSSMMRKPEGSSSRRLNYEARDTV